MGETEVKLHRLIQPLCNEENIFLEEISVLGGGKNRLVKIIVDTESGITLSQCQELSKKISDIFFRKDIFNGDYRLEVSSPGTDKPLKESFEFRRSIGKELHVKYKKENEMNSITGELITFDEEIITIRQKNDVISIALSDVDEAKIKLKW